MRPAPAIVAMLAACNAAPQPQLPASGSLDSIGSRGQRTATVLASGQVLIAGSVFGQSSSALRALAMRTQSPCMFRARFAPAAV